MKGFSLKGKFAKLQQSVKANVDKVKNQIEQHQQKSSEQDTPIESGSAEVTPVGNEENEEEVYDDEEVSNDEEEKDLKKSVSSKFKNANPMKFMKNMASSSNKFVKSFGQKSMAKISESTKSIAHITSNVTTNITKPVNIFTKVEISQKFIMPADLAIEKKSAKQIEKQNRTKDIDAQVLQMFSEEFFNDKYDPLPEVLESLPAECDEEEFDLWIMKMTTEKNVQLQIVDENLNKCISSNQGRFVEGIETINEFDLDIHRAEISLSNSRRQLTLVQNSMIVPALKIVNMKRRKMRLLFVLNKVDTIIKLFDLDSQLTTLIKEKKLGEAVKIAVQLQSILDDNSVKEIELLEPLEQRVKLSMSELKDILSTGLSDIILNFNIDNYEGALYSLIVLNKKGNNNDNNGILQLAEHIKEACKQLIETESRKKLIDLLIEIDSNKFNGDELEEKSFEEICEVIPYKSVVIGLIRIYEVITNIIHTHFLICQYHAKPFSNESHDMKYLHELQVESVDEDVIRNAKNNIIKTNNISYNEGDFLTVLNELIESKNEIWEKAEEQVSMYIRNVGIDNAKYKIEHWLALIDNSDIFCNLGLYYVGSEESYVIRNALRDKSADYFEILHKASKDILLSTLETEEWKRIPVSLQSMGGIAQLISQHRIYHRYVRDTSEDEHILTAYHEIGNPFKDQNLESTPLIFYKAPSMTIDENDTSPLGKDIITSSAINGFIKCTGIYVQFMECIPIIAMEIFERLCDLFKIYVYYVYSLFKPHDELVQWLTDCRSNKITYLNLYNLLCDGYKAYFGKDMEDTFIPSPLYPEVVTNLRLQTTGSAFHFEQRGVAIESIAFLIKVIKRVGRDIVSIAPELTSEIIDDFVSEVSIAYSQLEEDIYKSNAKQLSDLDVNTIPTMITNVKWNSNKRNMEQNQYMVTILKELHRIWRTIGSLIECQTLNESSVVTLWTYVIGDYCQKLLEGYSSIKKCSEEGRSNMSMDFAGIETLLLETHKLNGAGGISLAPVRNYINAYYMEAQEILELAKRNTKDYTYEQIIALANCINKFSRKDMNQFVDSLKIIYNKN